MTNDKMPEEIYANRYNYYRKGQLTDEVIYIHADRYHAMQQMCDRLAGALNEITRIYGDIGAGKIANDSITEYAKMKGSDG